MESEKCQATELKSFHSDLSLTQPRVPRDHCSSAIIAPCGEVSDNRSLSVHPTFSTVKVRRNMSRNCQSLPCGTSREKIALVGCPTGTILHGENEVFQCNRNDFHNVSFTLDEIWRQMGALFYNWKWIKWLRRLFSTKKKFFSRRDRPRPFPDLHCRYMNNGPRASTGFPEHTISFKSHWPITLKFRGSRGFPRNEKPFGGVKGLKQRCLNAFCCKMIYACFCCKMKQLRCSNFMRFYLISED
jgi:hypothetical protein